MVTGEAVGAIAMTEPGAGSDLQAMKHEGRDEGRRRTSSTAAKTFITNGQHCDLVVHCGQDRPGRGRQGHQRSSPVDCNKLPGFTRGRNLEKIGHHAADTSELFLEGVTRPRGRGARWPRARASRNLMNELPRERLILAMQAVYWPPSEGTIARTIEVREGAHGVRTAHRGSSRTRASSWPSAPVTSPPQRRF
jgi:acyl-CoA dehydrogenase